MDVGINEQRLWARQRGVERREEEALQMVFSPLKHKSTVLDPKVGKVV